MPMSPEVLAPSPRVRPSGSVPAAAPTASIVAACVIAYEAGRTIETVLAGVPSSAGGAPVHIYVADDASSDETAELARVWADGPGRPPTEVTSHPVNLGYGGNQVWCMRRAVAQDTLAFALVHGDAQYPASALPELVAPILDGSADVVLASRMLIPGGAKAGGMPRHRRVGNALLSRLQNRLTGADLSEWHTGLRAYRTETIAALDLDELPAGFDFDTAITLALLDTGARFAEIPIATHYGDEVSRIPVWTTGLRILWRTLAHRWRRP